MVLKNTKFNPTSHTHDDRYYTETEMDTKLSGKANSSHSHSKSQITDFPTSLKNPNAIKIQLNGATATTYDGSAAKSINITPSSIGAAASSHTHSQYYENVVSRAANSVLAAPNGSDGTASFRKLVASDIPSLNYLPLTGGTVRGQTTFTDNLNVNKSVVTYGIEVYHTKTPFIDFHYENDGTTDYTSRIIENSKGILNINGATFTMGGSVWCPTLYVDNEINGNINGYAKYLSLKGTNTYQGSDDNTGNWGNQGFSLHWYTGAYLKKQPSMWMYVINLTLGGSEVHQIACAQPGGSLYHRGGNSSGWSTADGSWATIVDTRNSATTIGIELDTNGDAVIGNRLNILTKNASTSTGISMCNINNYSSGISLIYGSNWQALTGYIPEFSALGTSENRWTSCYLTGNVNSSSDEKLKNIIDTGIDERYEKFFLKLNPILYKWKNGDKRSEIRPHDRVHCGLGARETEQHAIECGLDSTLVALICKDKLDTPKEDGTDDIYSLAYTELHGLEIHMIQKLYKEKEELENRIDKLEKVVAELQNK